MVIGMMHWFAVAIFFSSVISVRSDYKCVCSYSVETNVYSKPSVQGDVLGYLYEFDCKPEGGQSDSQWLTVAFEHQLGYIERNDQLQVQTCQGSIPDEDKLAQMTTTSTMKLTTTTTQEITTTEVSTTTSVKITSKAAPTTTTTAKQTTSTTMRTPTTTTAPMSSTSTTTRVPSTTQTNKVTTTPNTSSPITTSTQIPTTSKPIQTTQFKATTTKTPTQTMAATTINPIPSANTIQGHLELCSSRIQQAAKRDGAILAQFGDNCYEVDQSSVSWSHAESICHQHGGHLAHIANQKEQDFIYNFLVKHHSHTAWIGLDDRNNEESFEWTSGDAVTYTNWKPGRKDYRHHGSEDCVFMSPTTGEWDDTQCGGNNLFSEILLGHRHAYICQFATVITSTASTLNPALDGNVHLCGNHLINQASREAGTLAQYGHSCYEVVPNTHKTWSQAESFCHSRGGHLAHISSSQEQSFIQGFLQRYSPQHAVWIGLTDRHSEGHFHWTSGNAVHYTNWVPGHISNFVHHSQEDCVAFIPYKNGQWDDIPCGTTVSTHHHVQAVGEVHPVLCQYSISSGPSFIG
ncbi:C-type lectin domain family 4 member F-like isoform X2 [Mercenaria mercenaria]|uniref:C-type lectin domain family 4 member F-like isoform X2 n=1 Tax=Mercenaria mercenaria TaxID=6596 RepID=UPI00234EB013|nr:C-type lectin domain family 4 member F-like isoform X2 [Mercenaria mercenaria]